MAELFKAQLTGQHGFEKLVAIKKILPHLATRPDRSSRCSSTRRASPRSSTTATSSQVFELGTDADTPYIAMQYVDGLDVLALLRECARAQIRLPPELAALIAREVLDALDYAHNALDEHGRRARHRPPRHLAGQRAAVVARRRQAHRLRHRARRRAPAQDRGRHAQGQVRLHVARAGLGRRGRRAQRPVLGRHRARRDGDGAPAVHRRRTTSTCC